MLSLKRSLLRLLTSVGITKTYVAKASVVAYGKRTELLGRLVLHGTHIRSDIYINVIHTM